jgi:3-deoxy-D-manno-octulosonic-acid transferase
MDTAELKDTVESWLLDANERHRIGEKGREMVEQNRGALTTVLGMIANHLTADEEKSEAAGDQRQG